MEWSLWHFFTQVKGEVVCDNDDSHTSHSRQCSRLRTLLMSDQTLDKFVILCTSS